MKKKINKKEGTEVVKKEPVLITIYHIVPAKKKFVIGDMAYVCTSWGINKGIVVKIRTDKYTGLDQYKLDIDIDKNNKNIEYGFWYTADVMKVSKFKAIISEIVRPYLVKKATPTV